MYLVNFVVIVEFINQDEKKNDNKSKNYTMRKKRVSLFLSLQTSIYHETKKIRVHNQNLLISHQTRKSWIRI